MNQIDKLKAWTRPENTLYADFTDATLTDCKFRGMNLTGTLFVCTTFNVVDFRDCLLDDVDFEGAIGLETCLFDGASRDPTKEAWYLASKGSLAKLN